MPGILPRLSISVSNSPPGTGISSTSCGCSCSSASMSGGTAQKPWRTARIDLNLLWYKGAAAGPPFLLFFFLLPLWEKVAVGGLRPPFFFNRTPMRCTGYAKSVPDEGSLSAEINPSPGFASLRHPLPQGERGRTEYARPNPSHRDPECAARARLQMSALRQGQALRGLPYPAAEMRILRARLCL